MKNMNIGYALIMLILVSGVQQVALAQESDNVEHALFESMIDFKNHAIDAKQGIIIKMTAETNVIIDNATKTIDRACELLFADKTSQKHVVKIVKTIIKQNSIIVHAQRELIKLCSSLAPNNEISENEEGYLGRMVSGVKDFSDGVLAPFSYTKHQKSRAKQIVIGLKRQQVKITDHYDNVPYCTSRKRADLEARYEMAIELLKVEIYKQQCIAGDKVSITKQVALLTGAAAAVAAGVMVYHNFLMPDLFVSPSEENTFQDNQNEPVAAGENSFVIDLAHGILHSDQNVITQPVIDGETQSIEQHNEIVPNNAVVVVDEQINEHLIQDQEEVIQNVIQASTLHELETEVSTLVVEVEQQQNEIVPNNGIVVVDEQINEHVVQDQEEVIQEVSTLVVEVDQQHNEITLDNSVVVVEEQTNEHVVQDQKEVIQEVSTLVVEVDQPIEQTEGLRQETNEFSLAIDSDGNLNQCIVEQQGHKSVVLLQDDLAAEKAKLVMLKEAYGYGYFTTVTSQELDDQEKKVADLLAHVVEEDNNWNTLLSLQRDLECKNILQKSEQYKDKLARLEIKQQRAEKEYNIALEQYNSTLQNPLFITASFFDKTLLIHENHRLEEAQSRMQSRKALLHLYINKKAN